MNFQLAFPERSLIKVVLYVSVSFQFLFKKRIKNLSGIALICPTQLLILDTSTFVIEYGLYVLKFFQSLYFVKI